MGVATSMSHNQYRVCPPFAWRNAAYLRRIDITRLSTVTCGMFSHSSWRAMVIVHREWMTETNAWWRTSQTSFGVKFGKYAGQSSTWAHSSSKNSLHMWAMCGRALSCWKIVLFWWTKDRTIGRGISSRYLRAFILPTMACCRVRCPWDTPAQTCEAGNVPRQCRGHSSIVLTFSGWPSWSRQVAVVGDSLPSVDRWYPFNEYTDSHICIGCGWSEAIAEVKNPDIAVLGKGNHTRSPGMLAVCCRAKLLKSTSKTAYCRRWGLLRWPWRIFCH